MNKQKRNIIQLQAKVAKRVAKEIKPLYTQSELYNASERRMLNRRYEGFGLSSPAQAAHIVLKMSDNRLAKTTRVLISSCGRDDLLIEGFRYNAKMILMCIIDPLWLNSYKHNLEKQDVETIQSFHKTI